MKNLIYDHICSGTGCKFFVIWDFGQADCYSCVKIGESYNVTQYPGDCPFKSAMIEYEIEEKQKLTNS